MHVHVRASGSNLTSTIAAVPMNKSINADNAANLLSNVINNVFFSFLVWKGSDWFYAQFYWL